MVCFNIASIHLHLQNCQEGSCSSDKYKVLNKLSGPLLLIFSNCTCWWCWCWKCCCWYHPAYYLGGVWAPPPIFSTHWAWYWWSKPWLLTLVDYHWTHCSSVWLKDSHSIRRGRVFTDNITGCKLTSDKVILHADNVTSKTHTFYFCNYYYNLSLQLWS